MAKKKAIKLAAASAVAASAFVAAAPAQTDAASNVAVEVSKAVTQMKKAYHTYSDVTAQGKFAPIADVYKEYNVAKKAYANAKAVVTKAGGSAKEAYLAQLDATYNEYIAKRVVTYIDAFNYATALEDKKEALEAALEEKEWEKAEELYHEISYELNTRTVILHRVYGQTARNLLVDAFKVEAQDTRDSITNEVSVKMYYDKAKDLVAEGKLEDAKKAMDHVADYVAKLDKDTDFGAYLLTQVSEVKAAYEAKLAPAVESVSAINAKEIVVTFNTALAEGTTEAQLLAAFTLGTQVDSKAVLSTDRKSVTYTLDSTEVSNTKVTVAALDSAKKDSKGVAVKTAEYNSLLTFEDKTAAAIASVEAKGTTSVITFTEPVKSEGTVSLNGAALTATTDYDLSTDGKTLTVKNLEAEKTYRVDIVGATDFSDNIANPLAVSFTVAKPVVDNTKPTVTSSVSGTKITLDFSEELLVQDLDVDLTVAEFAKVTVGSTVYYLTAANQDASDKTKFTVDAASALGTETFINTSVKVEGFKDAANNAGDAFTFSTTLAKDTTKPSFAASSAKLLVADDKTVGTDLDAIYLTFNEPVKVASGTLTKKVQNGIAYTTGNTTTVSDTTGTGVDVDGNGKIEGSELNTVKLTVDLDANSTYTFELAGGLVSDLAGNTISDAITFNVSTGTFTPAPGTVTDSVVFAGSPVVVSGTENNVFTLEYAVDVTSSATNAANYTLGGQVLPAGTQLQFVDGTKKVRFTLPAGSISVNGSYVLEAKNVVDTAGNTLKDGKQSVVVGLKESVAPTASKVSVVNSKTFTVDFSEAIADEATATGLVVKIAGSTVTPASASVSGGKLTVTTSADFGLSDSISVEFKSSNLVDANGNKVKDGVVTK